MFTQQVDEAFSVIFMTCTGVDVKLTMNDDNNDEPFDD
ncbi:hypothetical protein GLIP_4246 [Aliiglaciecola lipolytica E3]|uniref:Uncharacterized protein n=1 Tax=Aliiglaciecola lipolytica E3 TaxID=1127673 RepID=K6YFE1_9ALTE|nr:hypothetical protein GLIP_4246 [Aliiglaciecola lipolytica E3]